MARLTYQQRKRLPKSAFVFPSKAPGPGSYPIHDRRHAINALARVSQHGTPAEKAAVRRAVYSRYPGLRKSSGRKTRS